MIKGFEWVIPVFVVIFWLVTTIIKNREREEPVRRRPGAAPDDSRRPTSDIDRFLQEIDKLKRKALGEPEAPTAKPAPPVVKLKPPRVRAANRPPLPRTLADVPVVQVVPVVKPVPSIAAQAVPNIAQISRSLDRRGPTAAQAAVALLRSPQSIAGAMILKEILGPPRCRQ